MTSQKEIITYATDIDIIVHASMIYAKVANNSLKPEEAISAFDSFHKIYGPMLKNYTESSMIREILNNFEEKLKQNYPGRY